MQYTRVYSDAAGDSHFEDVDVPMTAVSFAPPAPPMDQPMTPSLSASTMCFAALCSVR